MHHHHAVALLLSSIVFAAFALFTLCTFAPKVPGAAINNPALEEQSIESLAGLPIRRRSQDVSLEGPGEENGEALLAYISVSTPLNSDAYILGTDAMRPETIKSYPISRLLRAIEQVPLRHHCSEHMIPANTSPSPSLPYYSEGLIERTIAPPRDELTVNGQARNKFHSDGNDADLLRGGEYYVRSKYPSIEEGDGDKSSLVKRGSDSESDIVGVQKRNLFLMPDSGFHNNNVQQIDFDLAQRVASSAGLAPGFLIETEYLTPGRRTVQRMATGLKTRMAENSGFSDPESIIIDALSQHDVQDIPSYILQGSASRFGPFKSIAPPHFDLS